MFTEHPLATYEHLLVRRMETLAAQLDRDRALALVTFYSRKLVVSGLMQSAVTDGTNRPISGHHRRRCMQLVLTWSVSFRYHPTTQRLLQSASCVMR